ncbi:MAG: hypothetical protein ACK5DD_09950 [Cyclobacteriaceae bacterium]|jgi:hypothetical protein
MKLFTFLTLALMTAGCAVFQTINSVTSIDANNSFVLGNNAHNPFRVQLTNISQFPVVVYQKPLTGEAVLAKTVAPGQSIEIRNEKNTALIIENQHNERVDVKLKVWGDTNLSMNYAR